MSTKDQRVSPLNPINTGAGLVYGAHLQARPVANLFKMPTNPEFYRAAQLFKDTANVAPADFAHAYSTFGNEFSRQMVKHRGVDTPIGDALMLAKDRIVGAAEKILPERALRRMGVYNLLHFGKDPAMRAASLEHYQNFAKSPLAAYRQLLSELPEISMDNAKHKVIRNGVVQDDLASKLSYILSLPRADRNRAVMHDAPWGVLSKNKVDFTEWFDDLAKSLDLDPSKPSDRAAALRLVKSRTLSAPQAPTLVGHMNEVLGARQSKSISDTLGNPDLMTRFSNLLSAGRMRGAPKTYGKFYDMARGINNLARPHIGAGALTVGALATVPYLTQRFKQTVPEFGFMKKAGLDDAETYGYGLGALGLLRSGVQQLRREGVRSVNPWARIQGLVIGGADTGKGSFAHQTRALAGGLNAGGVSTTQVPTFLVDNAGGKENYWANDILGSARRGKSDFIVQLGAHPDDTVLGAWARRSKKLRYRFLSDYNDGNMNQPDSWLSGRNWMKVHDSPRSYDRLFVPGSSQFMPAGLRGRKPNVYTPSIPVSEVFRNTAYVDKSLQTPFTLVGMGGGAGAPLLFPDAHRVVNKGHSLLEREWFDPAHKNILDDVLSATRKSHGPEARVKVLIGNAASEPTAFSRDFLNRLMKDPRYKGLDFIESVPQSSLAADYYAKARNIVQLPGSTTAELMAMPGHHIPNVVNLLPDERKWWMPRHWASNHKYFSSNFPSASSLELSSGDREGQLVKAFTRPLSDKPRITTQFSATPIVKAIKRDVVLRRIANAGRISGKGTLAAVLGYMALSKANLFTKSDGIFNDLIKRPS